MSSSTSGEHAAERVQAELDLQSRESGPKRVTSLQYRRSPLAAPATQLRCLAGLDLSGADGEPLQFETSVAEAGGAELRPEEIEIFQVNLGKLCNMTCAHCHVDSGPDRMRENMDRAMVDACLAALDRTPAHTVDLTGGAPELNPHFHYLVDACVERGKHVIDRCNLTVLLLPRFKDLCEWMAERGVEVVCSLPHYRKLNTDAQRGDGTYEKSIEALRRLNAAGYGQGDPKRQLTLMSNPAGAFLAPSQAAMEAEWKAALQRNHGVTFDRLIALNNMPISRFLEWLESTGNLQAYMERLTAAFNPATVSGLMCRNTLSVSWDGRLFDCDFNQQLDMEIRREDGTAVTLADFDVTALNERRIRTDRHCYGCTAGAGSSCGGTIAED
ncbi:MAG: arsenosugar biosynthesis radical SAM (seleno)protein ArsS [Acidobacteriota bacterium]